MSGVPTYEWPAIESELEICSKVDSFELIPVTANTNLLRYPSNDCT